MSNAVARGRNAFTGTPRTTRPSLALDDMRAAVERSVSTLERLGRLTMGRACKEYVGRVIEDQRHILDLIDSLSPPDDGPDIRTATEEDWLDEPVPFGLAIGAMSEVPGGGR